MRPVLVLNGEKLYIGRSMNWHDRCKLSGEWFIAGQCWQTYGVPLARLQGIPQPDGTYDVSENPLLAALKNTYDVVRLGDPVLQSTVNLES